MGDEAEAEGLAGSSLIESNIHFLILMSDRGKSSQLQRRALLATANKQQIIALVEVAYNILYGNTELTDSDKQSLKRYRRHIRLLVSRGTKLTEKRELLSIPLVRALLKPITEKLIQHFCSNINSTQPTRDPESAEPAAALTIDNSDSL